ncbi:NADPH:quinone reductase, partial [Phenoliferia sp. Uapishka_3]
MKGYVIPRNLKLTEFPAALISTPEPVPSTSKEILITVHSAALNFFDILQIQGKHQSRPAFPWIAGSEFSGVMAPNSPVPEGCNWIPGKTRLFGSGLGAFAEVVKTDWEQCHELPEGMGFDEAAGLSVTFATSYAALVNRAAIKKGDFLLIHAAAGGVGIAALQIGKALGATVIATASASKLDVCKRFGADNVLDYNQDGWQKKVMEITKGHGADVVYDPVGMIVPSLKCVAWGARVVVVGFAAGAIEKVSFTPAPPFASSDLVLNSIKIPANLILLKSIAVTGVFWGAYAANEPEAIPIVWRDLLKLFNEKRIQGVVFDKVYNGLESVPEGLRALGARETWGKAIVRVRKDPTAKL